MNIKIENKVTQYLHDNVKLVHLCVRVAVHAGAGRAEGRPGGAQLEGVHLRPDRARHLGMTLHLMLQSSRNNMKKKYFSKNSKASQVYLSPTLVLKGRCS